MRNRNPIRSSTRTSGRIPISQSSYAPKIRQIVCYQTGHLICYRQSLMYLLTDRASARNMNY